MLEKPPELVLATVASSAADLTVLETNPVVDRFVALDQHRLELVSRYLRLCRIEVFTERFSGGQNFIVGGAQQHPPPRDRALFDLLEGQALLGVLVDILDDVERVLFLFPLLYRVHNDHLTWSPTGEY